MEPYVEECVQQGHKLSEKVQGQTRHTWYCWTIAVAIGGTELQLLEVWT